MSTEDNKAVVRLFATVGNSGDYEAFRDILAENFARHCQATPEVQVNSCDDFIELYKQTSETFPDQHVEVDMLLAEGDLVALYGRFSGTQEGQMGPFAPSKKRMEVDMGAIFRVTEGKIAELWVTWDNVAGLMQLGHLPSS